MVKKLHAKFDMLHKNVKKMHNLLNNIIFLNFYIHLNPSKHLAAPSLNDFSAFEQKKLNIYLGA